MISISNMLLHGALLSLGLGILILGSLKYNPRLWLQDYPEPIRVRVAPQTSDEKRQQKLLMIPFLLFMLGVPLYSLYELRAANGGQIDFYAAYLNTIVISSMFNLFDAVVIDLLILTFMQPKFAVIPGAEGMEYLYRDWNLHLRNFLKGIVFCALLSLPIALIGLVGT